jgi:hydrogenase maturation protein HypF
VSERIRAAIRAEGIVQGVGFRPFVYALATSLGLSGHVGNDADGVFAEVEGPADAVSMFLRQLQANPPPLARIDRVTTRPLALAGLAEFVIAASQPGGERRALVSADSATCGDCLRELADPADRRHGYPFINCTNCGPRFTIIRDVPYDRPYTTMSRFTMCARCAAEYHDPADRRFHAQPVCCPDCGPQLRLQLAAQSAAGSPVTGPAAPGTQVTGPAGAAPVAEAAALLRAGAVLAVKGLGGYHLMADARNEAATAALRARKHREDKPFALMVAGLDAARELCEVDDAAAALLLSRARPIVLMQRRRGAAGRAIAAAAAPGNRHLGLMLPYTPLHHLLLAAVAGPVVATSGNVSDEPIAFQDSDALQRLAGIADAFLLHDRAIHIRTDDSVVRSAGGRVSTVRRSRGYVPEPLLLGQPLPRPVLACGAELKNTFCLAKQQHAFLSHHIGDLENAETLQSFIQGIEHFRRIFDIEPAVVAHDLHPDYLSSKYAAGLAGVELTGVQHHHAHIASCLADNNFGEPVIGVAFDGTGYGPDGTIWGGEFLVAGLTDFERLASFSPVPMPGGAAAIRQPWRMAASYLLAAYGSDPPAGLAVRERHDRQWDAVTTMAARGINSPLTSSAGRLFDAFAAVLGVRDAVNYEGQAAIELEQLADPAETGSYPVTVTRDDRSGSGQLLVHGTDLIRAGLEDLAAGTAMPVIAGRFHNGISAVIATVCARMRERTGLDVVALSGGVFQNLLLSARVAGQLEAVGFRVLQHSRVPCNDGGISLGQAVVAGARDRQARAL